MTGRSKSTMEAGTERRGVAKMDDTPRMPGFSSDRARAKHQGMRPLELRALRFHAAKGAMTAHLINPSHLSFGMAVITPRWLYVLATSTRSH
jgi:hypothetical protein